MAARLQVHGRLDAAPLKPRRRARWRPPFPRLRRLDSVGHPHRVLLHLHHDAFNFAAQVAVGDERGDGDAQTGDRGDQRFGDTAGQRTGIAHAARLNGVERANDAGDGAEQAEQRRDAGDGAERVDKTLELIDHVAAGILQALHENLTRPMAVRQSRREAACPTANSARARQ